MARRPSCPGNMNCRLDRIPDVRHPEEVEWWRDRIPDVRHQEEMRVLAGQNSECEITGEGERWSDRIPDVRHPEEMGTLAGQNLGYEISGEGKSRGY